MKKGSIRGWMLPDFRNHQNAEAGPWSRRDDPHFFPVFCLTDYRDMP